MKVRDGFMNKEELHDLIEKQQANICQIVAYKNNQKCIPTVGIIIKQMIALILCQLQKAS